VSKEASLSINIPTT